jgi:hypothetical protein
MEPTIPPEFMFLNWNVISPPITSLAEYAPAVMVGVTAT